MNRIYNLQVSTKLWLLILLFSVGLGGFAWSAFSTFSRVQVNGPIYAGIIDDKDLIADILPPPLYLVETHLLTLQLATISDPVLRADLIKHAKELRTEFELRFEHWDRTMPKGPMRDTLLNRSSRLAKEYLDMRDREFLPLVGKGDMEKALEVAIGSLQSKYREHRLVVLELVDMARKSSSAAETAAATTIEQSRAWLVGLGTAVLLAVGGLSFWIVRSIARPLASSMHVLERVAAGDLSARLEVVRRDEIGCLAEALNRTLDKLQGAFAEMRALGEREREQAATLRTRVDQLLEVVQSASEGNLCARISVSGDDAAGRIGQGLKQLLHDWNASVCSLGAHANTLAGASEELAAVSHQMSANAEETAAQSDTVSTASEQVSANVQTVATGVEEMSASIREIASNSQEAAQVANMAVRLAEETSRTVTQLGESGAEIGQIIKVITEIAQQTNLLALNATIEAARAGEAGKGFAVVANEVKELARETAHSADEIGRKITAIQMDVQSVTDQIGSISKIINRIHDCQTTIASAVEQQTATTSEIARNLSEAAQASTEIAHNITSVAQAARNTSEGAVKTEQSARDLSHMAAEMQDVIGRFACSVEEQVPPARREEPRSNGVAFRRELKRI